MSKNAVMPLDDYKKACNVVREKLPIDKWPTNVIVDNKAFIPTNMNSSAMPYVMAVLAEGTLKVGERYYIKYTHGYRSKSGTFEVQNTRVQVYYTSEKGHSTYDEVDAIGLKFDMPDIYSYGGLYIYQDGKNIMLSLGEGFFGGMYWQEIPHITLEKITDKIVSGEMPEKINDVYEAGQKAEQDRFWGVYQNWGQRRLYMRAFYQSAWRDSIFNPKYDIITGSGQNDAHEIFSWADITDTKRTIKIGATNYNHSGIFYGCEDLKVIRNLDISEYYGTFTNWFLRCYSLEDINITGEIKNQSFNVSNCSKLTHDSLMNIIYSLKDFGAAEVICENLSVNGSYDFIAEGMLNVGETYTLTFESDEFGTEVITDTVYDDINILPLGENRKGVMFDGLKLYDNEYDIAAPVAYIYQEGSEIYFGISPTRTNKKITVVKGQTETRSITFGTTNLNKLTDAEKAIATQKGWTLV